MIRHLCAPLILLSIPVIAVCQTPDRVLPCESDVRTLDGIINAYYDVISGPAGASADRLRDESLHHPSALVAISGKDRTGAPFVRTMTLSEYHDRAGGPRERGFYEWEIHRVTQTFGHVTHVWSTYVSSDAPGGSVQSRGINSIQLYHDGTRWWIMSWIFDSERPDNPIPAGYLPRTSR